MTSHPNRGRRVAPVEIRRHDGTWAPAPSLSAELGRDGLGATDAARASARGILLAHVTGYATRDNHGRVRTVVEFSGDRYDAWLAGRATDDPVMAAFIDPRTGALDREALATAARLYLARGAAVAETARHVDVAGPEDTGGRVN